MPSSRAWCFTLNNYEEADVNRLKAMDCRYLVFQKEIAPTTNTPHIQGYVYFAQPRTLRTVKNLVGNVAHCEVARGTSHQNKLYCTKAGGFDQFEKGDIPRQGSRSDIEDVAKDVMAGKPLNEVIADNPEFYVKYRNGLTGLHAHYVSTQGPRTWKTRVHWYHGPTGTGKSHRAFEEAGVDAYYKMGGNKWWDGYSGQAHVVIDDFRRDLCPFHELLRLLDKYPHRVEYKGGSIQFLATNIWITCNKPPDQVFINDEGAPREDLGQLIRRIEVIQYFGDRYGGDDAGGAAHPPNFARQNEQDGTADLQPAGHGVVRDGDAEEPTGEDLFIDLTGDD